MTTTTESSTLRYRHAPDVLSRTAGDMVLILLRAGRQMLSLTGSGSHLWRLLDTPRTLAESARELGTAFGVPAETVERDIAPVLEQLHDQGVLVAETTAP